MMKVSPARINNLFDKNENIDPYYNNILLKKLVIFLSFCQLIMSILIISSQVSWTAYQYEWYAHTNPGSICGVIFGISGSFGIWSGFQPSKCTIVHFAMVFAIMSACLCIPLLLYASFYAYFDSVNTYHAEYLFGFEHKNVKSKVTFGVFISLAVIAFIQCVLSVASSALSCSATCCRKKPASAANGNSVVLKQNDFVGAGNPVSKEIVLTKKPIIWTSSIQIIIATVAVIANVVSMIYRGFDTFAYIGKAIWCGIPYCLCGAFGIWAGVSPSKFSVIIFMVFAIISTCFSTMFVGISMVGLGTSNPTQDEYCQSDDFTYETPNFYVETYGDPEQKITFGLFLCQKLIALIQLLISVNSSAMSCHAICCPTTKNLIP